MKEFNSYFSGHLVSKTIPLDIIFDQQSHCLARIPYNISTVILLSICLLQCSFREDSLCHSTVFMQNHDELLKQIPATATMIDCIIFCIYI